MRVAVIGTGYVGLVTGTCLATMGNRVFCVDVDEKKIDGLKNGVIPIYEPGLSDMVKKNAGEGSLKFTTDLSEALKKAEVCFIAVGTPMGEDGSADLKYVLQVAGQIGSVLDHTIRIHASRFTPTNEVNVPDGRILPVKGVFDLRAYRALREGMQSRDEQIVQSNGYDHNFLIDAYDGGSLVKAADLKGAVTGRRMGVWTTLPGIQLYGGNHFDRLPGKDGMRYNKAAGVALETQFYPDAPHHPAWPQPTVKAGETQRSRTEFRFFAD